MAGESSSEAGEIGGIAEEYYHYGDEYEEVEEAEVSRGNQREEEEEYQVDEEDEDAQQCGTPEDDDEQVFIGDGLGSSSSRRPGDKVALCAEGHRLADVGGYASDEDDTAVDRDMQLLQAECLPVSGAPLPPSAGPPQTADEYLRQVQWERLRCPEIMEAKVSDNPKKEGKSKANGVTGALLKHLQQSTAHTDDEVTYSAEWAADVAAAFRAVRAQCDAKRVRGSNSRTTFARWKKTILESKPSTAMIAQEGYVSLGRLLLVAIEVFLKELPDVSQPLVEATLEQPVEAAEVAEERANGDANPSDEEEEEEAADDAARPHGSVASRLDHAAEWAYAALAFTELPIFDDAQFQLQRLRRGCVKTLLAARGRQDGDHQDHVKDLVIERVSLLLVIVTEVFGQR